jgi:hypothetical protein
MRGSRTTNWAHLKVYFALLLLGLFTLGALLAYASSLVDPSTHHDRADLRSLSVQVMGLAVIAGAAAFVLKDRLLRDIQ